MKHISRMLTLLLLCCIALISASAVFADNDNQPLCHVPPGNPAAAHVINPGDAGYDAHLNHHDDYVVDAGHPCPPETEETDVCPNISGDQPSLPADYHFDDAGNCIEDEVPVDVCDNLPGDQDSVPVGYHQDGNNCFPDDECPEVNVSSVSNNCEEIDYCPNISDVQPSVPVGYVVTERGECVPEEHEEASAPAAEPQRCVDVFHPFLAVNGFDPVARGYLVENTSWAGYNTDLTDSWYVWLNIVPADRDTVRAGNDAGILCSDAIASGPQIIAFRVLEDGEEVTVGLVLVHRVDDSLVIDAATILRGDILSRDPFWGGTWE